MFFGIVWRHIFRSRFGGKHLENIRVRGSTRKRLGAARFVKLSLAFREQSLRDRKCGKAVILRDELHRWNF